MRRGGAAGVLLVLLCAGPVAGLPGAVSVPDGPVQLVAQLTALSQDPLIPEPPPAPEPAPALPVQPEPVQVVPLPDPVPAVRPTVPDPVPAVQPALPEPVPIVRPTVPEPVPIVQPTVPEPLPAVLPDPAAGPPAPLMPEPLQPQPLQPQPLLPALQPQPLLPAPIGSPPPAPIPAPLPAVDPLPVEPPLLTPPLAAPGLLLAPGICPQALVPGEIYPPSVWSVCPEFQVPNYPYWPLLPRPNAWEASRTTTQVPWVTGYPLKDAERALALAGLPLGKVTGTSSGVVVSTDPPFGSAVEFGHPIDVVVAPER